MGRNTLIIDPPEGWKYGFPKVYDKKDDETLEEWLHKQGYPDALIPVAVEYSRYWHG